MKKDAQIRVPLTLKLILVFLYLISIICLSYGNYSAGTMLWEIAVNTVILSIPLSLLFFSIGVLFVAKKQKQIQGYLSGKVAKFIYWTPRIAAILIIIFVGMFSLDVFSEGGNFWEMFAGFLIHSIPSIVMAVVLVLSWRCDRIGFYVFLGVAILFLLLLLRNPLQQLGTVLLFSGPTAVIAFLFWANWKWQKPRQE